MFSEGRDEPKASRLGQTLTRFDARQCLQLLVARAQEQCTTLRTRRLAPHTLRHTTAMHLLQAGLLERSSAFWLGHESANTTHLYIEADLSLKEAALRRLSPPRGRNPPFRAEEPLRRFLDSL